MTLKYQMMWMKGMYLKLKNYIHIFQKFLSYCWFYWTVAGVHSQEEQLLLSLVICLFVSVFCTCPIEETCRFRKLCGNVVQWNLFPFHFFHLETVFVFLLQHFFCLLILTAPGFVVILENWGQCMPVCLLACLSDCN